MVSVSKQSKIKPYAKPFKGATPSRRPPHYLFRRNLKVVALLIVAMLAGGIAYHIHADKVRTDKQFAVDQQRFAATEKNMAAAYAAITQSLGQPFDSNHGTGCSYGAQKYSKGPLGCTIYYTFSYAYKSQNMSKEYGEEALNIINNKYGLGIATTSYSLSDIEKAGGYYYSTFPGSEHIGCELLHETYGANDYDSYGKGALQKKAPSSSSLSLFYFSCLGAPTKPLYNISEKHN